MDIYGYLWIFIDLIDHMCGDVDRGEVYARLVEALDCAAVAATNLQHLWVTINNKPL